MGFSFRSSRSRSSGSADLDRIRRQEARLHDIAARFRPGDAIVQVNNEAAPAMFETALRRSISGAGSASASHRRTLGAVSLFAGLPEGSQLVVVALDGARRTVNAPARVPDARLDCTDPMGREYLFEVRATIRPDGIGVFRLPGFFLHNPPPNTTFEEQRSPAARHDPQRVQAVEVGAGIVWDLRANGGGMTPVAYDIMAGTPGTSVVATHTCKARVSVVEPPTFQRSRPTSWRCLPPISRPGSTRSSRRRCAWSAEASRSDHPAF